MESYVQHLESVALATPAGADLVLKGVRSDQERAEPREKNGFKSVLNMLLTKMPAPPEPVDPVVLQFRQAMRKPAVVESAPQPEDLSVVLRNIAEEMGPIFEKEDVYKARKAHEAAFEAEVDKQTCGLLAELLAMTDMADYLKATPVMLRFEKEGFQTMQAILLPSMTFVFDGKVFTRNCTVDDEVIKPRHPLCVRSTVQNESIVRSKKVIPGRQEMWAKAIQYEEGLLIRYFTSEAGRTMDFTQYFLVKDNTLVTLNRATYDKLLKEKLARSALDHVFSFVSRRGAQPNGGAPFFIVFDDNPDRLRVFLLGRKKVHRGPCQVPGWFQVGHGL